MTLHDKAAGLLVSIVVATPDRQRRADSAGARLDDGHNLVRLLRDDSRNSAFQNTCLLGGDLAQRRPELLGVVHRNRHDDGEQRIRNDIRRVMSLLSPLIERLSVASIRPPRPTSSSSTSAGVSEKARKAAAVVISNCVMSSPSFTACTRISTSTSESSSMAQALPSEPASAMRS